jgi:hypothetical protein
VHRIGRRQPQCQPTTIAIDLPQFKKPATPGRAEPPGECAGPRAAPSPRAIPWGDRDGALATVWVVLLKNAQVPIVPTALFYRAGSRDEPPGRARPTFSSTCLGAWHWATFAARRRSAAECNAFTSHDVTAYWFPFAADRWSEGLAIEADRPATRSAEVDSERSVILKIAMYEDDLWDALELGSARSATIRTAVRHRHERRARADRDEPAFHAATTGRTTPRWSSRVT